jgi:hypothetical protein
MSSLETLQGSPRPIRTILVTSGIRACFPQRLPGPPPTRSESGSRPAHADWSDPRWQPPGDCRACAVARPVGRDQLSVNRILLDVRVVEGGQIEQRKTELVGRKTRQFKEGRLLRATTCSISEVFLAAACASKDSASASLSRPACTSARAKPLSGDCCGLAAIVRDRTLQRVVNHQVPTIPRANPMMH